MHELYNSVVDWLVHQFTITFIDSNRYQYFVQGFLNTLRIVAGALAIGVALGTLVAVVRVYSSQTGRFRALNRLCGGYLAVFRGTPLVVQLLIMYYIIFASVDNGLLVATLTFGINSGAYVAEIVRAGILAVDYGQTEAGRSLGLTAAQTMYRIVLPQAFKNILPALGNEFVTLIKETSVAGYVAVLDFARAGAYVRSRTMEPYFSLVFIAFVYFLLVYGISSIFKAIEKRMGKGDRGAAAAVRAGPRRPAGGLPPRA